MDLDDKLQELQKMFLDKAKKAFEKNRVQAGKLTPELYGLFKANKSKVEELLTEVKIHKAKIAMLESHVELLGAEWWAKVKKEMGLNSDSMHIEDDGTIFVSKKN